MLMVLGLKSQHIDSHFSSVKTSSSASWTLLSQLDGCPCCLKNTKSVTECYLDGEGCGPALCNCDGSDPACMVSSPPQYPVSTSTIWRKLSHSELLVVCCVSELSLLVRRIRVDIKLQ